MKLVAAGIDLQRGARTVISGLSFTVQAGEALVLTGPNGAGKTTLLRALAGLLAVAAGSITLEGATSEATVGEQAHYIGHHNAVKSSLTAAENLAFWARYLGDATAAADARATAALDRLGLGGLASIPAQYLSAGQKRRLGLARLLVADRPVWLLDEPSVSLDQASVALLGVIVNAHVAAGGIAIAATHLPLGLAASRELQLVATRGASHDV